MTDKFKKRVREHAEKNGMTYQAAHQQLSTTGDEETKEHVGPLYKFPPPDNDTATESAEEAFHAWVKYAEEQSDLVHQRDVQLAGCSVATQGYAKGDNDATPGMYGHSVAFDDVKALYKRHMEVKGLADALWQLLDDIDTASDAAKSNDKVYREIVERIQKKRWDTGVVTDGYRIYVKDWPTKRKEGWLNGYDPGHPAEPHGGGLIDGVGPEIFADPQTPTSMEEG